MIVPKRENIGEGTLLKFLAEFYQRRLLGTIEDDALLKNILSNNWAWRMHSESFHVIFYHCATVDLFIIYFATVQLLEHGSVSSEDYREKNSAPAHRSQYFSLLTEGISNPFTHYYFLVTFLSFLVVTWSSNLDPYFVWIFFNVLLYLKSKFIHAYKHKSFFFYLAIEFFSSHTPSHPFLTFCSGTPCYLQ